jgi:phosphatidylserine/phosphatidylglycerophosphate/cardiolipin synthase-like enzyme
MIPFAESSVARLPEREYFDFALASVESARRRVWASIFIYDIRPSRDLQGQVLDLTSALVARRQVGVDVRVLLNGPASTPDISVANLASGLYLIQSGVPHRRVFGDPERRGSHAKFVVVDDHAIVGSQNWTDDGFRLNIEDAAVLGGTAVDLLAEEFARLWADGRGMPRNAAD